MTISDAEWESLRTPEDDINQGWDFDPDDPDVQVWLRPGEDDS